MVRQTRMSYISIPADMIHAVPASLLSPKKVQKQKEKVWRISLTTNLSFWAAGVCGCVCICLVLCIWCSSERGVQEKGQGQENASTLGFLPAHALATNLTEEEHNFWKQPDDLGYRPCVEFSKEFQAESLVVLSRRRRYLMVVVSGGLNQQRNQIVDAVVIARILEATLVVPILQVNQIWGDESEFSDIFDVEHLKQTLKDELRIISSLPSTHVMKRPVEESKTPLQVSPAWIRSRYMKRLNREGVLLLRGLDSRLSKDLPSDLQKLRCKVAFHALRFAQPIRELGGKLAQRMWKQGPYVALHLRLEKDVWVRTGCLPGLSSDYDEIVRQERKDRPSLLTARSNMSYHQRKLEGLCPLNAMEVARLLKALGAPSNAHIYWAGGEPLGGIKALEHLTKEFPNFYNKRSLALPGELDSISKKESVLAAIDYIVSLNSDVFMPSHGGNMGHAIQGHRAYGGHRKHIRNSDRGTAANSGSISTNKASSSNAIQQNDNQMHEEGVQTATAHEMELGTQNHTHSSEGIMGSPFQACDAIIDRSPIDLVTVLDVSGSMSGTKLVLLKRAMGFVIQNLSPADRLAVVVFSSTAKRLFPLRHMTEEGRRQSLQAVDLLVSTGGTNIAEGLRKGSKVLEDRRERNPVSSIMLLSDGQDTHNIGNHWEVTYTNSRRASDYHCLLPGSIRHASQHGFTSIPVHTFGFGSDHDAIAMHSIAEASGGTFSFIETESFIQDAFAQCIGGLLSVMIQDVQVAITSSNPDVQLVAIQAGGYASNITDEGQQGLIKIGDLYAEEERDFLIDVKLPALLSSIDGSSCNGMKVFNVICTYKDPVSQKTIQTMVNKLAIERPESISMEQQSVCLEVDRQRNRLSAANSIADARACADRGDLSRAQLILGTTRTALQKSLASQAGDELCKALESELTEIQERMANAQLYENSGRAYVLSAHISHSRQRATTRGQSNEGLSMVGDYKTSKMLDMLTRSQTMCPPAQVPVSRTLLPSKTFPLPESRSSR